MKRIALISVLSLLVCAVQAQDSENRILLGLYTPHWDDFEYLFGKVKEIHYQSYHISGDEEEIIKGKPFTHEEAQGARIRQTWSLYFDRDGKMIYMKLKYSNDNIESAVVHWGNNRIENMYWIRNDSLLFISEIIYDNRGNVEHLYKAPQDTVVHKAPHFVLDKNGYVIKAVSYGWENNPIWTVEYIRNDDGKIKELKGIDTQGNIKNHYSDYKYNDRGLFDSNIIELLNYEDPGFPRTVILYEYDEHGNWIKRIHPGWMMIERKIVYYE